MFAFFTKTQYSFEGKKTGEIVAIFLHRHWFSLASRLVVILVMTILPLILYAPINGLVASYISLPHITLFLYAVYFMFVWSFFIYTATMYFLDSWLVTNERVLNNRQHGFFNRTVSEMNLSRVQDVTVTVSGIIPTMLNFGDVLIQTAGEQEKFVFEQIPNPGLVKDNIMKMVTDLKNASPKI